MYSDLSDKKLFVAKLLERLEQRIRMSGESEKEFSARLGSSDALFKNLRKGSLPSADRLDLLLREIGVALTLGKAPVPTRVEHLMINGAEYDHIALHDAELSAGPGSENGGRNIIDHLAFRRDWLRNIGVSASDAVLARATGDSMWPTIHGGDIVLIDRRASFLPGKLRDPKDTRPVPIFAILDDGAARIKRLVLATPGTMALLSDNPDCPPEFRPVTTLSVIGKVMWWGHTNREK